MTVQQQIILIDDNRYDAIINKAIELTQKEYNLTFLEALRVIEIDALIFKDKKYKIIIEDNK